MTKKHTVNSYILAILWFLLLLTSFFVSIMEAIYCGCHPLVPNTLHYPELIQNPYDSPLLHAPVLYEDEDQLFQYLKNLLEKKTKPLPKPTLHNINKHLDWSRMYKKFDRLFEESSQALDFSHSTFERNQ